MSEPQSTVYLPDLISPIRQIGPLKVDFGHEILTMAIINRTPDSFFDQGATFAEDKAVTAALAAVDNGAQIIDIGGVKFAPGEPLPAEAELERVLPVVTAIVADGRAAVSVDTFQPLVAERAIAAGASIINDTTGGAVAGMFEVVAASSAQMVLTHSLASPREEYPHPQYADVALDVREHLAGRIEKALACGVAPEQIIVDPGADLNKNTLQTLELTRRLPEIASLGYPMLAAISNKDFIGEATNQPKHERGAGTCAAAAISAAAGARILRMHDVRASLDVANFVTALTGMRVPEPLIHNV